MRRFRAELLLLALVIPPKARAHVVSISTGELHVDGPTATFELRIPMYEVAQIQHPETVLLEHIRFADGHLSHSSCHQEDVSYVCDADYEFPSLHRDSIQVECTLFQVTVPNHVHLLTATQGSNTDQEVFDQRFRAAEVRFHPPSAAERILRETGSGVVRVIASPAGVLFLLTLALAARTRREALVLGGVFLAAEYAARPVGPLLPLALSARLLEAILALTVAYLAVEILLLPESRWRWLIVGILGLCHGLSLAGFPAGYLLGALLLQAPILTVLCVAALKMPREWSRPAATLVLVAALAWFGTRLFR